MGDRGKYKGAGTGAGYMTDVMKDTSRAVTPEQAKAFHSDVLVGVNVVRRDSKGNIPDPAAALAAWDSNWEKFGGPARRAAMERRKRDLFPPGDKGRESLREQEAPVDELLENRREFERERYALHVGADLPKDGKK